MLLDQAKQTVFSRRVLKFVLLIRTAFYLQLLSDKHHEGNITTLSRPVTEMVHLKASFPESSLIKLDEAS